MKTWRKRNWRLAEESEKRCVIAAPSGSLREYTQHKNTEDDQVAEDDVLVSSAIPVSLRTY